jgi:hypothetical protein
MSADESLHDTASPFEYDYCLRGRSIRLLKFKPRLEGNNSQQMNLELTLASVPPRDAASDDNSASGDIEKSPGRDILKGLSPCPLVSTRVLAYLITLV